jgi:hypothetical protein
VRIACELNEIVSLRSKAFLAGRWLHGIMIPCACPSKSARWQAKARNRVRLKGVAAQALAYARFARWPMWNQD